MKFAYTLLICTFISMSYATELGAEFIPEASAACRVGETLLIGGDEEPQAMWLVNDSGKISKIKVNGSTWDDLEGMAKFDATNFFALTSHSRTKKGKRKAEREQLMFAAFKPNRIDILKKWSLREQVIQLLEKELAKELDMRIVESASPDEGGLNIEGLALLEEKLYLGLRSPLTKSGKALILVINNAKALLEGATPAFDNVISVDLSGNGIRGLDTRKNGLLILAGSSTDAAENFGLLQLSLGAEILEVLHIEGFEKLLRPEGVVAETNGDLTFVQDFETPQEQDIIVRFSSAILPL